jgi:hypothetical protein
MSPVRRRLAYVIAWTVATAVTVIVAWLGIRSVLVAAAPRRVSPLSAAQLRGIAPHPAPTPSAAAAPTPAVTSVAPPVLTTAAARPTPSDSWAPVADGKGGTAFKRTFRTGGGDVVVVIEKGDVKIPANTPKPGFVVSVNRQGPDSVLVSFIGPRRASRVWARWAGGPYAEVTEVTGYTS